MRCYSPLVDVVVALVARSEVLLAHLDEVDHSTDFDDPSVLPDALVDHNWNWV